MSDRTQIGIGRHSISAPRIVKRILEAIIGTGLTCLASLAILVLDNLLTNRGGWFDGFDVWRSFVRQPAILGTMFLTSFMTALFLAWQRHRDFKG